MASTEKQTLYRLTFLKRFSKVYGPAKTRIRYRKEHVTLAIQAEERKLAQERAQRERNRQAWGEERYQRAYGRSNQEPLPEKIKYRVEMAEVNWQEIPWPPETVTPD